jgi:hypothetical protein
MKTLATLIICFGLFACKTCKKSAEQSTTLAEDELIGIVHVNENHCPIYIAVTPELNPGKTLDFNTAYPINLKDGMKKKGLKVKFTYTASKAMLPEGCSAEIVIQLDTITVIP